MGAALVVGSILGYFLIGCLIMGCVIYFEPDFEVDGVFGLGVTLWPLIPVLLIVFGLYELFEKIRKAGLARREREAKQLQAIEESMHSLKDEMRS